MVDNSSPLIMVAILATIFLASYSIYAIYLHPLRDFPGPKLSAVTRIPYWIVCLRGNQVRHLVKLHKQYGPVVRFAPDDLSYADGRAWKDIAGPGGGAQKGGGSSRQQQKENPKEVGFHAPSCNGTPNLVTENDPERHAAIRRVFSPAFSERALKAQEPLFHKYADLMVRKGGAAGTINMTELLNWATFDIMADLAFGESLGLLEKGAYSSWIAIVFNAVRVLPFVQMVSFYPLLKKLYDALEPKSVLAMRLDHFNHTVERVDKRLREGSERPDLWNLVEETNVLMVKEMHTNAELFMLAGTETTASLLTGLTYHLLANPEKMKILTDEIRSRFENYQDITFEALAQLDYLNACIREGLRVYPSIPSGIPRVVADGGNIILGKYVPGGTRVSVHQTATYRSPANFK
ncbi:hypothetical protein G7054_g3272 [Neopestalotiopsis clavispora]|nr:hypothetical protein G7054_g3272 [Neopestalotiopsis clavispora]